jgi:LmbE family N-acetylglucosaminyl deacetylase
MAALLFAFAHPDDETFATGGTVARYAEAGTVLVCATRGEAGRVTMMPDASRQEIGRVREGELRAACAVLGVAAVEVIGLPDGGLAQADPDALTGAVVRAIRRHRPRAVVTFGPEGAPTGHVDHRAISRAATAAYFLAGIPTAFPETGAPHRAARLFYFTWEPPRPGDELQLQGLPADVRIATGPWRDAKWRAFVAHESQRHHEKRFRSITLDRDEFYALASGVPVTEGCGDLLAGLGPADD